MGNHENQDHPEEGPAARTGTRPKRIFGGSVLIGVLIVLQLIFLGDRVSPLHVRALLLPLLMWACVLGTYAFHAGRERLRLEEKLQLASEIQMSLLPESGLSLDGCDIEGLCNPVEHVGGDFFDYWIQNGRLCVMIADVTGHDVGAALLSASLRSVVRGQSTVAENVAHVADQVNRVIYPDMVRSEMLLTLCYLEIDPRAGQLTYCRCGHPRPLLVQRDEEKWLSTGGMLLGVREDAHFEEESVDLSPGDTLVLYTDGVIEAEGPDGAMFGTERLAETVRAAPDRSPRALVDHIVATVDSHTASKAPRDDVSVVVAGVGSRESGVASR